MSGGPGAAAPRPKRPRFDPTPGVVVVDKYRVERVLGEGGMGVVVAATHLGLDQRVAIKFLHPEAMRHKEAVERFQREAKVAAKVKSEHVTRVHDVGTLEGGEPFIVMEYLEGSDLRDLIRGGEPLPIPDACEIALQSCEALAEVHAAGIVHRDLKPSNLFVTRRADGSPCVKLLDFGISKFSFHGDSGADPALTATATVMGSPSYMSPEQLKSSREVDSSTDVWSLGVVLYEAVTGRPAFRAETVPQVCAMIASDDPPLPSSVRPDIPMQLERAILDCLQKKPEKRARLVDLARSLVDLVPERARVSLERIEAVLGESDGRPRPPRPSQVLASEPRKDELPILPLATATPERSISTSETGAYARRGRGSGMFAFLVFVGLGVLAAAVYTGSISIRTLRGEIAGAASAVASAVGSVSPSTSPAHASSPPTATAIAAAPTAHVPTAAESATANATTTQAVPQPPSSEPEAPGGTADAASAFAAGDQTEQPTQPEEPLPGPAMTPLPAPTALTHPPAPPAHSATTPAKHHTKPKHSVKVHRRH